MKRIFWIFLVSLLVLNACAGAPAQTAAPAGKTATASLVIKVTDALEREVTLKSPPSRIVIAGKGAILTIDAAYMFPEASARIIALGNSTQGSGNFAALIDPEFSKKTQLQNEAGAEQIAAVQPDLVILKSYLAETIGKPLEALKIPVIYVDLETPEQFTRDLAILGKIFQNEARAQELAGYYTQKVSAIQAALKDQTAKPRALMLYYNDRDGVVAFNVPPVSWIQTQMVGLAGGIPAWGSVNTGSGWAVVNLEQIAAWDADQIFIISYQKNTAEIAERLKNDAQWKNLRAVKEGRLYGFPADVYSWDQSGSRWILGLSWLAARLHPERFPKFDIVAETQQFYQQLYRLDAPFFDSKIRPLFKGSLP